MEQFLCPKGIELTDDGDCKKNCDETGAIPYFELEVIPKNLGCKVIIFTSDSDQTNQFLNFLK